MNYQRVLVRFCIATVLGFASHSRAQTTDGASERLPGSHLSVEDAADESNLIVVGTVTHTSGMYMPTASGTATCNDVRIKVLQTIVGGDIVEARIIVRVQGLPPGGAERRPQVGDRYLMMIDDQHPEQRILIKSLDPSDASVARVREIMKRKRPTTQPEGA